MMNHLLREIWVRIHVPVLQWLGRAGWAAVGAAVVITLTGKGCLDDDEGAVDNGAVGILHSAPREAVRE